MTGLINSGILTNPKIKLRGFGSSGVDQGMSGLRFTPPSSTTNLQNPLDQPLHPQPLKGSAPAVASTSQALTATPGSGDGFGEQRDAQGNSFLPGEPGYQAPPQADGSYRDAQGNSFLPGEAGYPAQPQGDGSYRDAGGNSFLPGEPGYPAQPVAAAPPPAFDLDAWAKAPQTQAEVDAKNAPFQSVVGAVKNVAGNAAASVPGTGRIDWEAWENTPWEVSKPPPKGELEDPGIGEDTTEKGLHDLDNMSAEERATIDQIMKHGGLGPRDFDQFYDNAWKHSERDLNSQYAARGMSNSSDALRALGHSRTDLAAQQSKDEADCAMKSWTNDMSRLATVAGLQGKITDQDLDRWGLKQQWTHDAQRLEEGRLGGYLTATETAFNSLYPKVMASFADMTEADQKQVAEIIGSLPAMFQDTVNQDSAAQEKALASLAEIVKLYSGGKGASAGGAAGS